MKNMSSVVVATLLALSGVSTAAYAADPYPYDAHPVADAASKEMVGDLAKEDAAFWETPVTRERYQEVIRPLQAELKKEGCYDLKIDGITGSHTYRAIKTWQSVNHAPVNGIVSETLVQAVMSGASLRCDESSLKAAH